ncbi:MAG: 6-phosphogluconolactonase [Xanthobacteraceae bacterium]
MKVERFASEADVARAVSDWMCELARRFERFSVCLSGGSTPRLLYADLAQRNRAAMPWEKACWFFGDERCVPYHHPESNYGMALRTLFEPAAVALDHVHPVATSATPHDAASKYEAGLWKIYGAQRLEADRPLFNLVLLGLGEDGHTASLFPGSPVLKETQALVAADVKSTALPRITLTYPALESASHVAFLVTGEKKRDILRRVWAGERLPAAELRPSGTLTWFIDRAADPA